MIDKKELQDFIETHWESGIAVPIIKHLALESLSLQKAYFIIDTKCLENLPSDNQVNITVCAMPLNVFKDINAFLIRINNSLKANAIFIARVTTLENRSYALQKMRIKCFRKLIHSCDFIFKRVLPSLPPFSYSYKINKLATHRLISKCEALGRLRYCGFDIEFIKETNNYLYIIAFKSATHIIAKPLEGIIIKVPKIGKGGRTIYCYKLRTMHAYANLLHDFILKNLKIDNEGKVVDDFRMTGWGKFLRKTWLDEMPQLINIIKGDLSIVGLRPLSWEFLSLYPEEWRKERNKYKPGFVPPYYVDCPKTFDEIIESEKKYCVAKNVHPVKTDVIYFIKAALNFIKGNARTG